MIVTIIPTNLVTHAEFSTFIKGTFLNAFVDSKLIFIKGIFLNIFVDSKLIF